MHLFLFHLFKDINMKWVEIAGKVQKWLDLLEMAGHGWASLENDWKSWKLL